MVKELKAISVYFWSKKAQIDNLVSELHHATTVAILLAFSTLTTLKQLIGEPIHCTAGDVPIEVLNKYCWIHSTFSVVNDSFLTSPHPGVSHLTTEIKYHKYYQWVGIIFFLQALFFYAPRYLWKTFEGEKVQSLVKDLMGFHITPEEKDEQINNVVKYLVSYHGQHNSYAKKYLFCEFLYLVNVVVQFHFLDYFVGKEFYNYGLELFDSWQHEVTNEISGTLDRVFPKVTKCTFYKYGPSGTIEKIDGICVLPLNNVNDKIFFLLWIWLIGLGGLTLVNSFFQFVTVAFPSMRPALVVVKDKHSIERGYVKEILKSGFFGDFLLLSLIDKNVSGDIFDRIVAKLYLRRKEDDDEDSRHRRHEKAAKNGQVSVQVDPQESGDQLTKSF